MNTPTADALAADAKALIADWRKRHVPKEDWLKAYDLLVELAMLDEDRGVRAMENIGKEYEKWRKVWDNE